MRAQARPAPVCPGFKPFMTLAKSIAKRKSAAAPSHSPADTGPTSIVGQVNADWLETVAKLVDEHPAKAADVVRTWLRGTT